MTVQEFIDLIKKHTQPNQEMHFMVIGDDYPELVIAPYTPDGDGFMISDNGKCFTATLCFWKKEQIQENAINERLRLFKFLYPKEKITQVEEHEDYILIQVSDGS